MESSQQASKLQKIQLTILISGQIIAIFCQYYLIVLALSIKLILIINEIRKAEMKQIQLILIDYCWIDHHRIIKNCLQFMKCIRMIQHGYDSKSNTNIILQEQKQQQQPLSNQLFDFKDMSQTILKVLSNLKKIKLQKDKIIEYQVKEAEMEEQITQIKRFKDMFSVSKQIDKFYGELSQIVGLVQKRKNNQIWKHQDQPSVQQRTVKKKLSKLIVENNKLINRLSIAYYSSLKYFQLNEQFNKYKQILSNKSTSSSDLQPLIDFANKCQDLITKQINQIIIPLSRLQIDQSNKQPQKSQQKIIDKPNFTQKKQFMKKLDTLLMIGLAKKRQEQFQQKMKLLQLQQLSNSHQ